jgi:hypothetical protein
MKFALRFSSLWALALAFIAGIALFAVSQQVQRSERDMRVLKDQLAQEQEAIRVLRAEWDYLNRPDRLEALASKYLNMSPVHADSLLQSVKDIQDPQTLNDHAPLLISNPSDKPQKDPSQLHILKPQGIETPLVETPNIETNPNKASASTTTQEQFNQILDQAIAPVSSDQVVP